MAKMLEVTSCCGCGSLRTGTIIIGIIDIIFSGMIVILNYAPNINWEEELSTMNPNIVKTITTLISLIGIFAAALLLVGVFKRNNCMMVPWLVLAVITAVSELIDIFQTIVVCFVNHDVALGTILFIATLIGIAIGAYLWLVVYSYHQQLKSDQMNGGVGMHERPRKYQEA